ncbi:MAG: hypothetical protein EOP10_07300 [Proteobacteria bacterium]|nr:MAG: hypothetical protein EOP10_07300 [Pseudomonadota bacterium]
MIPLKISLLLTWMTLIAASCASQEKAVEFTQVLLPNRADIGRLAVVLDGEIDPKVQERIISSLKKCPLYSDVKVIDKPLTLQNEATVEVFDQFLQKNAKGFGGLLKFRMEHLDTVESSEKSQSFALFDQAVYDWYPSFGVPRLGTLGFADRLEIGPEVKKRKRSPSVKTSRYTQVYRMSFYHKPSNKIILDRVAKNIASLSLFSKDSGLSKTRFEEQIRDSVLTDIGFYACPPSTPTVRHIYYNPSPSTSAQAVSDGFESANKEDWESAAQKWNDVIAKEPKNALAHHNLGVYYERLGDIPSALPHYRIGFRDKRVQEDAFGDIVGRFLPASEPMEATVVHVTGGSWIFVDVPAGEKRTRASVFRVTPIIDPDSSRVTGQTLKEIALLRFVTSQETRRAARVREYLLDSPVRPGDLVVFTDANSGSSSTGK